VLRRQNIQSWMLLMATVDHRNQSLIALAGWVGEHLESSSTVMDHIGVQTQVCIRLFALAELVEV
jgi:hypothetical protein